jgi:hypothetical protein
MRDAIKVLEPLVIQPAKGSTLSWISVGFLEVEFIRPRIGRWTFPIMPEQALLR